MNWLPPGKHPQDRPERTGPPGLTDRGRVCAHRHPRGDGPEWEGHDLWLGPVREAGYRKQHPSEVIPLIHAKVVVFAYGGEWPDGGPLGEHWEGVIPTSVWWGSANLTKQSRTSRV